MQVQAHCVSMSNELHLKPPLHNQFQHVPNISTTHPYSPSLDLPLPAIDNSIASALRKINTRGSHLSQSRLSTRRRKPGTQRRSNVRVVLVRIYQAAQHSLIKQIRPIQPKASSSTPSPDTSFPKQRPVLHRRPAANSLLFNNAPS